MAVVRPAADRATRDYYPTPPPATAALCRVERFFGPIWEPCAGEGWMVRELRSQGYEVIGTDISEGDDVLRMDLRAPNVVTNPPYGHNGSEPDRRAAEKIALCLLAHDPDKVCLLMPFQWWCGVGRAEGLFTRYPVSRVWAFADRFAMWPDGIPVRAGTSTINFAWFVWDKYHSGPTELGHVMFNA